MKEPVEHQEYEDGEYGLTGRCEADGKNWPCKTRRRWTASKDYRIAVLEQTVQRLGLDSAGNRRELEGLREAHRRLELLVRGGVLHALTDAGVNGISESVEIDYQDHTLMGGGTFRSAGPQEYKVTFTGRNSKYVNGELVEAWSP